MEHIRPPVDDLRITGEDSGQHTCSPCRCYVRCILLYIEVACHKQHTTEEEYADNRPQPVPRLPLTLLSFDQKPSTHCFTPFARRRIRAGETFNGSAWITIS